MAAVELRIDGLDELRAALRALPLELAREGEAIALAAATGARDEIASRYPSRSGNLQQHLALDVRGDARTGVSAVVKNTARHAWIFENGTAERHHKNGKNVGAMPAGRVFIPIAIRRRRDMEKALLELVRRAGFTVTGVE